MSREELRIRARRFVRKLRAKLSGKTRVRLMEGNSLVGGGSCPDCHLPTTLIALESDYNSPNAIESRLRSQTPPIILRVEEGRVLVDLRTVFSSQEPVLIAGLRKALESPIEYT